MKQSLKRARANRVTARPWAPSLVMLASHMIEVWPYGPVDKNMPEEILVETRACVGRYPWWQARSRMATALLEAIAIQPPMPVLDISCGLGSTLNPLETVGSPASMHDVALTEPPG